MCLPHQKEEVRKETGHWRPPAPSATDLPWVVLCAYVCMWLHAHACSTQGSQKRAVGPRAGVQGDCEPSDVDAGNGTPSSARAVCTLNC